MIESEKQMTQFNKSDFTYHGGYLHYTGDYEGRPVWPSVTPNGVNVHYANALLELKQYKKAYMLNRKGKFYIRMSVMDKPGVLADITAFFKRQKISISTMFQLEKKYSKYVQLIFVTHLINEKQLILAIKKIEKLAKVKNKVKFIRIENSL